MSNFEVLNSEDNYKIINHLTAASPEIVKRIIGRLTLGYHRYGHGVRVNDDTREWGTKEDSWKEMLREEIEDAIVYCIAHGIRTGQSPNNEILSKLYDIHSLAQ